MTATVEHLSTVLTNVQFVLNMKPKPSDKAIDTLRAYVDREVDKIVEAQAEEPVDDLGERINTLLGMDGRSRR